MYVRGAKKREEVWLLDRLEELGFEDPAFRSRDYVVALDEQTGEKAGLGRLRMHTNDEDVCELAFVGVLDAWRGQGVGAHLVERLVERARDEGFETVYTLTEDGGYFGQFGFSALPREDVPEQLRKKLSDDEDLVPMALDVAAFSVPDQLRERFKRAGETDDDEAQIEETPEDFGIDPDEATYKYDTGR